MPLRLQLAVGALCGSCGIVVGCQPANRLHGLGRRLPYQPAVDGGDRSAQMFIQHVGGGGGEHIDI